MQEGVDVKSQEFCYWLQGFFELRDGAVGRCDLTIAQVDVIRAHLALVFKHEIDPSYSVDPKVLDELDQIHQSGRPPRDDGGGGGQVYRC